MHILIFPSSQASLDAEKALDDLSKVNEMLRVDIEKWGEAKDREMCSLMTNFADSHITYHQKVSMMLVCIFCCTYSPSFGSHIIILPVCCV